VSQILDQYGKPIAQTADERLRAEVQRLRVKNQQMRQSVEAAGTDEFNSRLFQNADSLGPNAAFSEGVRQRTRDRARHEHINNGNARGLVRTHAYDLIGTCPRLQQLTIPGDESGEKAEKVERSFAKWQTAIQMGFKARLMERAVGHSGESFAILQENPKLKNKVKLDWRIVEAEQLTTPWNLPTNTNIVDGIEIDAFGNRLRYFFLKYHPGESRGPSMNGIGDFLVINADKVLHWFECDRAGQLRGLPKTTSGLKTFAQVRRWDEAALTAAEFAAMIAGILTSNLPVGSDAPQAISNWEMFELLKGMLLTLPQGYDFKQADAKQPTANHDEFKRSQQNDAGRGSGTPLNVTTGNSSGYNYSSGRLDHVPYHREKRIDRFDFRNVVLDPTFIAWEEEARIVGEIEADLPAIDEWAWEWNYDGFEGIDAEKDAKTDDVRLRNGSTNFAEVESEYGRDWRKQLKQLVKEVKAYAAEGLVHPFVAASKPPVAPVKDELPPDDEEDDEEETDEAENRIVNRLNPSVNGHSPNGVHHG